ncbi:ATP-binding protein [Halopolyspora algeriensis]|uniref:ATP-binding protein n=1 Tax=Halopolyspora algeriensis TaxID=1500506 RepID=UPI0015D063CB|nr:ATP-binding protein [Halopolyspora algeriensis]
MEVRVSAEATQLSVMRAVVGDLAMRADFDVDSIADLRLAVDEACSSLVRRAAADAWLLCRFRCGTEGLTLTAEVTSNDSSAPRTDTFSWRVLSALTDTVASSVEAAEDGTGKHVVRIELRKGRMGTSDVRGL